LPNNIDKMNNPSLRTEKRNKPAAIISSTQQISILDWLASTGRLIARESNAFDYREDVEDLQELIVGDDPGYAGEEEEEEDMSSDDDEELD
jgi:hypothetical protein